MEVLPYQSGTIHWRSYDIHKVIWLEVVINTKDWSIAFSNNDSAAARLISILVTAKNLGSTVDFNQGFNIWTRLEFDQSWGLGSSSTLLSLVAQWTGVNPYQLASLTFGGSGYDIACALADGPISYQRNESHPTIQEIDFDPSYKDHLCFVHLGEKKDTQEALKMYASLKIDNKQNIIQQINELNQRILKAKDIAAFCQVLDEHETLISSALKLKKIKEERFSEFNGSVKSLGAWGGDFVLAASTQNIGKTITYFNSKDYKTVVLWEDMVLQRPKS